VTQPFLGEIRMFGGNFPPRGWAVCSGQLLDIGQNDALFSLLGTTYGGDGVSTFALPDLRGRVPIHTDGQYPQGDRGGVETVTLTQNQMPGHAHGWATSTNPADTEKMAGGALANTTKTSVYGPATNLVALDPRMMSAAGSSQPHDNMQPWIAVTFIIALEGIYPARP
jgi:microcystin-dependent protein